MVKFTKHFTTWRNSETIAQYGLHKFLTTPQHLNNNPTTWWNSETIAQHDEIHKQLHEIMKYTNNCPTWWNSETIAQLNNISLSGNGSNGGLVGKSHFKKYSSFIERKPKQHLDTPHDHNCTTWWNSQTFAQHGEIHKQLHNMVKFIPTTPKQHST